jgi:hypothetical protein
LKLEALEKELKVQTLFRRSPPPFEPPTNVWEFLELHFGQSLTAPEQSRIIRVVRYFQANVGRLPETRAELAGLCPSVIGLI